MIVWHIGKQALHQRAQTARDSLHQPGPLSQSHHAEPKRHDADQTERDRDRCLRSIERAVGYIF